MGKEEKYQRGLDKYKPDPKGAKGDPVSSGTKEAKGKCFICGMKGHIQRCYLDKAANAEPTLAVNMQWLQQEVDSV